MSFDRYGNGWHRPAGLRVYHCYRRRYSLCRAAHLWWDVTEFPPGPPPANVPICKQCGLRNVQARLSQKGAL